MTALFKANILTGLFIFLLSLNLSAQEESRKDVSTETKDSTTEQAAKPTTPQKTEAVTETNKKAPEKQISHPDRLIPETVVLPKTSEAFYWVNKVDELINAAALPERHTINTLYSKLSRAFDSNRNKFESKIWKKSPEASHNTLGFKNPITEDDIYQTINTLYYQRLRLLDSISSDIRNEVTGTGVEGVEEVNREIAFLKITLKYRITALPKLLENLVSDLKTAPLPTIGNLLQFLIAIILFRYWRRWAPEGLLNIRKRILKSTPRTKRKLRLIKLVWYFDQIKAPIAWLVLWSVLFRFIEDPVLTFFIEVGRITVNWILISWAGVLLINALISRNSRSLKTETTVLTLRSLQYIGTWLIFSGLDLELISRYAGEGTLYAWVFLLNEALLVILLLFLLKIWRPTIFQSCENEPQQDFITEAVLHHQKGISGFIYSIVGAIYLLYLNLSKLFIDWIANFNTGQQVLDSLLGMEMARAYQKQKDDPDAQPLPPELEKKLLSCGGELMSLRGNSELKSILSRIEKGPGGAVVLIGETGVGKTTLLQRVCKDTDKNSILVSCPKEGLDALIKELARKLHVDHDDPKRRVVFEELRQKNIDVLVIDNLHWLIRPYVGGQDGLNQLAEIFAQAPNLLCVLSLNTTTWQFILRARSNRIFDQSVLTLRPWSVEQISKLIKNSCEAADINPDFSDIVIPRQYDDSNFDDPKERTFSGFIRILHGAATGNPQVALGLWVKCLYINKQGKTVARLPRLPSSDGLDNTSLTLLLVLKVICQSEIITRKDITKSLQLSEEEVAGALQIAVFSQWVEVIDDNYYQLNWYWRKVIMRVLARQNLMARSF